jgi:photosystem II stability/assembly factor-like uncharacterized protein
VSTRGGLAWAVALAGLVVVAGCGGTGQRAALNTSGTTVPTTATPVPATTSSRPTTTPAGTTTTAGAQVQGPPSGGPVPSGFDPVSFTAVSDNEFWLLGEAPCTNPVCTSIVRTTDGGAHFVGIPAPTSALDVGTGTAGGIDTLRFADALDGYAYDTNPGGAFWDTRDGGAQWSQPSFMSGRGLLAFGTGAGYAFALVGTCQNGSCAHVVLERSPLSSDDWTPLDVPVPSGVAQVATMTVHGDDVWFSLTPSVAQPNQMLFVSTNSGSSFTTAKSPCLSGLAGSLQATSATVVWAACPTGMMAEAFRSTDGGAHWEQLTPGELENSAFLAPASDTTALLQPASQGQLLRTDDGGATWHNVSSPVTNGYWSWIGFTDRTTGAALAVQSSAPADWPWPKGPLPEQLWRTTDGGTSWASVSFS